MGKHEDERVGENGNKQETSGNENNHMGNMRKMRKLGRKW